MGLNTSGVSLINCFWVPRATYDFRFKPMMPFQVNDTLNNVNHVTTQHNERMLGHTEILKCKSLRMVVTDYFKFASNLSM